MARSRQTSYADVRRYSLEFQVGDRVMLKVSPWKGVIKIGKREKLSPRYKCLLDENLVIPLEELSIDDKLHFFEEPVEVMDREVKRLKHSRIPIVKGLYNSKVAFRFYLSECYLTHLAQCPETLAYHHKP
ncbi:uncharacterized protein [Rutidosis leptorrhynchoides]|uniref:uncharacterized protein n=1 Tax=Rutidosis leptorrhynchoides TaxID=125765 RepID=UPI003A9998F8